MNAVKKLLLTLGALCAVALFAAVCGLSAVWAVRNFAMPAAVQPVQTVSQQTAPLPAASADPPAPPPAAQPPAVQQPVAFPPPPAAELDVLNGVYSWSLTRVMERSHTGRELRRYADDYVKVLNASIAELDRALAGNDRRLNRDEAKKLREQYVSRRDGMTKHTEEFLTRIVAESAGKNEDFEHVSLIEEKNFTRLAASADLTTKVIELIDHFHMQLPPLPKPLKLPPAPRQEQNRASPSKAPPRRGK